MAERPILIVDGYNVFIRHYMVNETVTTTGEPCGGVIGFIKSMYNLVRQFNPSRMFVVWEQGGACPRRKKIYPDYKKSRSKTKTEFAGVAPSITDNGPSKKWMSSDPQNKITQTTTLVGLLKKLPICQLYIADTECDDVIAHLVSSKLKPIDALKIIVSSDRDFYQLLEDPNVRIFNPADKTLQGGPTVEVKLGKGQSINIPARNYVATRILTGDDSDNIPGIPGLGFRTVLKIFPELLNPEIDCSIKSLIESAQRLLAEKKPLKVLNGIVSSEDMLKRNWQLMYLSGSTLTYDQMTKVNNSVDRFSPVADKLGLIKAMLSAGIISTIDFDLFVRQFQTSLCSLG